MDKQLDHERIDGELRILEAASADAARRILKLESELHDLKSEFNKVIVETVNTLLSVLESAQLKELKEANKWKKMN